MLRSLTPPCLLFLGDAHDMLAAKTARGLADWRPQHCLGQLRLPDCRADLGLPDLTIAAAKATGVKTVVVGVANRGGVINAAWIPVLEEAIDAGLHLAAGLLCTSASGTFRCWLRRHGPGASGSTTCAITTAI